MDSRYNNNNDGSGMSEQVVEYEEVVLEDPQQQYVEVEIDDSQTQYYEEYVQVDEGAIVDPNTVYYEQVIEEKPILRSTNTTFSNIGNSSGSSNYYNPNQRIIQPSFAVPSLPVRPLNHQGILPRQVIGYPRPKLSPATSLVYTPSTLLGNRRDSANHPFSPNFLHIFPTSSKPPKIRKVSSKKKPCNCNKSMCLKLYCDCFANGEFCLDCNCKDCHNNLEHEAERSRAIKASLERNPSAFKPKIGVAAKAPGKVVVDMERLHQRGCNCKRSNCLKNYCECYEAKVPCTDRCKCQSCRNTEQDRHNKFKDKFSTTAGGLAQLAAAAAADSRGRGRSRSVESDLDGSDLVMETEEQQRERALQQNPKAQPWFYMTDDVIEATTMCLVSQAQEYEQSMSEEELEKSVLKEFGRCLEQIIESATSCLPSGHILPQPQLPIDVPTSSNVQ